MRLAQIFAVTWRVYIAVPSLASSGLCNKSGWSQTVGEALPDRVEDRPLSPEAQAP